MGKRVIESLAEIEHGYYHVRVWRPHESVRAAIESTDSDLIGVITHSVNYHADTETLVELIARLPNINAVQIERARIPVKYEPIKIRRSVLIYPEWP